MTRDLNIDVPDSLFSLLLEKARQQGISVEMLCLSILEKTCEEEGAFIDPKLYQSLNLDVLRREIQQVVGSGLPPETIRKRVNALDFEISRRYIR